MRCAAEAGRHCQEARRERDDLYTEDTCAWALYRAGRLDEAEAASRKALALGTPDARLLHHAGAIRLARGDRTGLALVRRALRLNPGFDLTGAAEAKRLLGERAGERTPVAPSPPTHGSFPLARSWPRFAGARGGLEAVERSP